MSADDTREALAVEWIDLPGSVVDTINKAMGEAMDAMNAAYYESPTVGEVQVNADRGVAALCSVLAALPHAPLAEHVAAAVAEKDAEIERLRCALETEAEHMERHHLTDTPDGL
jgi:hypothetical protein